MSDREYFRPYKEGDSQCLVDAGKGVKPLSEQPDALTQQHVERLARSVDRLALSMDSLTAALDRFMMAMNPDQDESLEDEQPATDMAGLPINS